MSAPTVTVTDAQGTIGTLETAPGAGRDGATVAVRLSDDRRVRVPVRLLHEQEDGSYRLDGVFERLAAAESQAERTASEGNVVEKEALPLVEEEVRVRKEKRETGRVHIRKRVREHTETIDEPMVRETVDVKRVPVDAVLDEPAQTRQEGDTTIIPVMEERLVVEKKLVLVEELHVTRRGTGRSARHCVAPRRSRGGVH